MSSTSLYSSTSNAGTVASSNLTTLYSNPTSFATGGSGGVAGVSSVAGGVGIGVSPATGNVVVTNTGVTSIIAGSNISVNAATGAVTVSATDTNTTYAIDASAVSGGANFNLTGSDLSLDTIKFASGVGIVVSRTDASTITITNSAPDTNTTYTQDFTATSGGTNLNLRGSDASVDTVKFANGTGFDIAYTDANTATLTNTGVTSAVAGTGVSVSAATGAVTVSIGQNVATSATPVFAGLTLNGSTSGSVSLTAAAIAGSSTMIVPAGNDVIVARNTTDTLTNKTISGVNNTITGIGNSSLVNSSITLGTTTTALGATSLTLGGLTSVAVTQDPVSNLELATKQYVDQVATTGLAFHQPVYVATVVNVTAVAYNQPGGAGVGVGATLTRTSSFATLVIDGVTVPLGARVLVRLQTTQQWNGVYTVTNTGSPSTGWVLTRATDADTYGSGTNQLSLNDYFFVQNGTTQKGIAYVLNAPAGAIIFGTSAITFAEFSSSQVYTATSPVVITGTDISLTTVPISLGGTGQTTATAAINALMPSQSGNANSVLTTDGTNLAWTNFTGGFAVGNITIAVDTDNTISTTAGPLILDAATNNVDVNANLYIDGTATFNNGTVNTNASAVSLFDNASAVSVTAFASSLNTTLGSGSGVVIMNNDLTVDNDLAVNGGDISSTSATTNIFTNVANTAVNIGAANTNLTLNKSGGSSSVTLWGNLTQNNITTQLTGVLTTISVAQVVLASTNRQSMKVVVNIIDNVTGEVGTVEILCLAKYPTTTAYHTTYAELYSGGVLATFDTDVSGGNLRLLVTPTSTNSTSIRYTRTSLA